MKTTTAIILLLLYYGHEAAAECNCTGVLLQGSDQLHCWEVVKAGSNAWSAADNLCSAKGGRLGFPTSDVYPSLVQYLKSVYSKPIFVATVVGSVNPARYANMCPANNYTSANSTLIGKDATSVEQCGYIASPTYQIEFYACDSAADVLCDIPLEKVDECGMDSLPNTCSVTTKATTVADSKGTTAFNATGTTRTTPTTSTVTTVTTKKPNASNPTVVVPIVTTAAPRGGTTVSTKNPLTPCVCPTCPSVNPSNNATNCGVSTQQCCEKPKWKFPWISSCIHWGFFILMMLVAIFGPIFLFCCCHCCFGCETKRCQYKQIVDPETGIKTNPVTAAPPPVNSMYEEEKTNVLPPQPIDSTPAVIPEKIDTLDTPMVGFGLISREVQIIHPDKPVMKDAGVNTDPWEPRRLKKKFVPKKRFPSPEAYIIGVDDPAEEVNIEVIRSPSPNMSVGPKGDVQPPIVFMRNRAPEIPSTQPEGLPHEPTHVSDTRSPKRFPSPPMMKRGDPATVINLTGKGAPTSDIEESKTNEPAQLGPRKANFPSPPTQKRAPMEPENVPDVQVDPATPRASAKTPNRFPSPPRSRSQEPPAKKPTLPTVQPPRERQESSSPQRSPPSSGGSGMMQPPNVSLKAPKGKLGGAVRAGSNGTEVPPGWKPWSKGAKGSGNGQYLNND